jgi:DNA-directed RNA polymerase specialized sigma subunit
MSKTKLRRLLKAVEEYKKYSSNLADEDDEARFELASSNLDAVMSECRRNPEPPLTVEDCLRVPAVRALVMAVERYDAEHPGEELCFASMYPFRVALAAEKEDAKMKPCRTK